MSGIGFPFWVSDGWMNLWFLSAGLGVEDG